MKKLVSILFCFGYFMMASAQDQPKIGDALTIYQPSAQTFKHIDFPRLNILVKRGKIPNYKSVYGNAVVITEVITQDDGKVYVILKKKDGSKFFGFLSKVKANYAKALEAKEMTVVP